MGNTEEKKYFLKDNALTSVDDDFFRHQDVTNNIIKILETTNPPYNIAVIGKWGLGKSSLLNMVTKHIDSDKNHFMKIEINAWKYEKEVLAKVFLRQVRQGLFPEKSNQTTLEQFKEVVRDVLKEIKEVFSHPIVSVKRIFSKVGSTWGKYALIAVGYVVISFILYLIYKLIDFNLVSGLPTSIGTGVGLVITGYARNMAEIVCGPLLLILLTGIYEESKSSKNDFELKVPALGVEDYEIYLEREIEKKLETLPSSDRENFKIVIILDDLDRLSIPKMVEALDAIKMFIEYKNCIFIVPFDDAILKNAIEKKRINPLDDIGIQSELLLDKLFQYKVYLPQLLTHDIKKYSVELCKKQIPDFVQEYMNNDWKTFNDVLCHILIHNEIETPRQVKKIVNAFVSNVMIAYGRQNAGNTEPDFVTKKENIQMLAKISVLQADFNEFYDLLFVVDHAIEISLSAYQGKMKISDLPSELKKYFNITSKSNSFPKSALPLMNFLISTNRYQVDSIYPYLYMAMDDISIKTGSKRQQEFRKVLLSRNIVAAREQLKEIPDLIDVASYILNDENDLEDITNTFFTAIGVYDLVVPNQDLIKAISKVCEEVIEWIDEADEDSLNYENILEMYKVAGYEERQELSRLLQFCLLSSNSNQILNKTEVFVSNYDNLDTGLKEAFYRYIDYILAEKLIDVKSFISLIRENSLEYNQEWSMTYYQYLIDVISENGDFSVENIAELEGVYNYITTDNTADTVFRKLEPLFGATNLSSFFLRILKLEVGKLIKKDTISKLIEKQMETENTINEDDAEINPLLVEITYKVDVEKVQMFDMYFKRFVHEKIFPTIINNYCKNNDISLINFSIEAFIEYLFDNISLDTEEILSELIKLFDDSQIESLKKKIEEEMAYSASKSTYLPIGNIINIFSKQYFDKIKPVFSKWTTHINTYGPTIAYMDFLLDMTNHVIEHFDDSNISTLFDVVKKFAEGKLSDAGINIICNMGPYISDNNYSKIISTLCKKATLQTSVSLFYFMDSRWHIIKEQQDYDDYCRIAVMTTQNERYINDVIQKLGRQFEFVGYSTLKNLFVNMVNTEANISDETIAAMAKLIDGEDIEGVAKLFFELFANIEYNEKTHNVFKQCKNNSIKTISEYVRTVPEEYKAEKIMTLLDVILYFEDKNLYAEMAELALILIDKIQTEDENAEFVDILIRINKESYKGQRKLYGPIYAKLFEKTSSLELKQKLAIKAKEVSLFKDVKISLSTEKSQTEWLNYAK